MNAFGKEFKPKSVKEEWVVQRFPMKGGIVLRSAIKRELYDRPVKWMIIEEKEEE